MKKLMMLILSGVSVIALSGCGGGSSDYNEPLITYFLQTTPDGVNYEGVNDVYYECGPDIVGYTGEYGASGSFSMMEGDTCTFYDLDDTRSYEIDILYIGLDAEGTIGVEPTPYHCDSGIDSFYNSITDNIGGFIFDPEYINNITTGDICEFQF